MSSEDNKQTTEATENNGAVEKQVEDPTISLADLSLMAKCIHVCVKRGAFEPHEMKVTGELYEKIINFLNTVLPKEESKEEEGAETKEEGDEETSN